MIYATETNKHPFMTFQYWYRCNVNVVLDQIRFSHCSKNFSYEMPPLSFGKTIMFSYFIFSHYYNFFLYFFYICWVIISSLVRLSIKKGYSHFVSWPIFKITKSKYYQTIVLFFIFTFLLAKVNYWENYETVCLHVHCGMVYTNDYLKS